MSDVKPTASSVKFTTLEVIFKAVVVVPTHGLELNVVGRTFQDAFERAISDAKDDQNFCLGYNSTSLVELPNA